MQIFDVHHWYFLGESFSKGKLNDHVFHNAALEEIVSYYKKKLPLKEVVLWTDNCCNQYKCRFNFWKLATFYERMGVRIRHRFAQKYGFKGTWDAAGRTLKAFLLKVEMRMPGSGKNKIRRCPDAIRVYTVASAEFLEPDMANFYKEWEATGDHRIESKGRFGVDERFFGFAFESEEAKEAYVAVDPEVRKQEHLIVTPRKYDARGQLIPSEFCVALEDTQKIFGVDGPENNGVRGLEADLDGTKRKWYNLDVCRRVCRCLVCRGIVDGSTNTCKFQGHCAKDSVSVRLFKPEDKKKKEELEITTAEEKRLRSILRLKKGENMTCGVLQKFMKANGMKRGRMVKEKMVNAILEFDKRKQRSESEKDPTLLVADATANSDHVADEDECDSDRENEEADVPVVVVDK